MIGLITFVSGIEAARENKASINGFLNFNFDIHGHAQL